MKKYIEIIYCQWEIENLTAYIVIKNKNGEEIYRKHFLTKEPIFEEEVYYGKLGWADDRNILYQNKQNNQEIVININL